MKVRDNHGDSTEVDVTDDAVVVRTEGIDEMVFDLPNLKRYRKAIVKAEALLAALVAT
jgi:hypothetical protein